MHDVLKLFHPLIQTWFRAQVGVPTDIQQRAWPEIVAGRHVLVAAPTGTGKTLTAFLWAIQHLITGHWPPGLVRILYVSPLKALNNDVRRNLIVPLEQLRTVFAEAGEPFPNVQVQTRSGDTESSARQAMVRRPPEILITTPESLNLILSAPKARLMLRGVQTVILDEIHAVAGTKRGAHLMTAVERVVPLAGEFQRIALSATVKPMQLIADFVGGFESSDDAKEPTYRKRAVCTVQSTGSKAYTLSVRSAPSDHSLREAVGSRWPYYADALRSIFASNRTTLVFTNNRRLCERLAMLVNDEQDESIAYAHHGSLSREMREVVERRLKDGQLAAIVATSSLELGIDIGDLDEVVLVQTPPTIASTIQRIGRAGHRVGGVSRAILFPTDGKDFLYAAAMTRAVLEHDVEPIRPIANPLDVLAQVIVSMTSVESWHLDALYAFVRTCHSFRDLPRRQFDAVVGMLAGRYGHARVRALDPIISVDAVDNTVRAAAPARSRLYTSGGTIPDRGYFNLRLADSRAKIGELDEEFVWERRLGESFTLGTQAWKIQRITHNDVLVAPVKGRPLMVPFWRAENMLRPTHFSLRLAAFLEDADRRLDEPAFRTALIRDYAMEERAADDLLTFLHDQRAVTGAALPHAHHVVVEHNVDLKKSEATTQVIVHTMWGGTLNKPWAFALAQAWEKTHDTPLEVFADNDVVILALPPETEPPDVFALVSPASIETLLRTHLERTGFFGARFRENAARALLLPKQSFRRREPLWWNRQRSQKLLEAVRDFEDFPILVETWRTCIQDEFELDALRDRLNAVKAGVIAVSVVQTATPSPFCESILWQQTNMYMYMDDTPASKQASKLREDVLKELVFRDDLRPRIPAPIAETFRRKAQRVYEDYAPTTSADLLDWIKERQFIPLHEWVELLEAIARDGGPQIVSTASLQRPSEVAREGPAAAHRDTPQDPNLARRCEEAPPTKQSRPGVPPRPFVGAELSGELCESALDTKVAAIPGVGVLAMEQLPFFCEAMGGTPSSVTLTGAAIAPPTPDGPEDALTLWLAQWLRFYGPVAVADVYAALPVDRDRLDQAIDELVESQTVLVGALREGSTAAEICDAENFEILLRILRAEARPAFEALDPDWLPLFLALRQGLTSPGDGEEGVQRALEPLLGYAMPAAAWETEVLPARVTDYRESLLDAVMQESDLRWVGVGQKQAMFAFESQLDLARTEPCTDTDRTRAEHLFPGAVGKFGFTDLLAHAGIPSAELARDLWQLAWRGCIANDSMETLRNGIASKFRPQALPGIATGSRRRGFRSWKATRPFPGHWYRLPDFEPPRDLVEEEDLQRDRVRLLLDRYGILFRELLVHELPVLRWGPLFRTMRLMELSGELVAGHFFRGIAGLQFMAPNALEALRRGLDEDAVYMVNATDPASLCGVSVEGLKETLPPRVASTHLVYHGRAVVLVTRKTGKDWEIHVPPEDKNLPRYLESVHRVLARDFAPAPSLNVAHINDKPATRSDYLPAMRKVFDLSVDPKCTTLWRRR